MIAILFILGIVIVASVALAICALVSVPVSSIVRDASKAAME